MEISIRPLFDLHNLGSLSQPDKIYLGPRMSGLESEPRNDWLHVTLAELGRLHRDLNGGRPSLGRAAFIGSANGIDVIAALRLFRFDELIVTDIVPDILSGIEDNIKMNVPPEDRPRRMTFRAGRDCDPVEGPCDLIYANLPLLMAEDDDLTSDLATTTLTDLKAYSGVESTEELTRWSLLPQLGFLHSAKAKLASDGVVITLIGGRIPDAVIAECFERAGMTSRRGTIAIMRQSDPQYMRDYARREAQLGGATFVFYEETMAAELLARHGLAYPSILDVEPDEARRILQPAAVTGAAAWDLVSRGGAVGHLAFGFRAGHPR